MIKRISISLFVLCISVFFLSFSNTGHAQDIPFLDFFQSKKDAPKQYFVETDDGWKLSLKRYKPVKMDRSREPLILCHGFNYNSTMWDLDEEHSLARYLKEMGYDVWAVDLRGSGDSSKPALSDLRSLTKLQIEKIPQILIRAPMNVTKFDWTIDDHIHRDLPAVIDFVKEHTKKNSVTWIGHSMGGIVMYGYLVSESPRNIKKFIAAGSMVNVKQPPNKVLAMISSQKPVTDASLLINTTVAYQLRNLTLGTIKLPWENLFYNKDNMDDMTTMKMFRLAIDDTAPGVIAQFSDMIKSGDFMSVNKKFNYTKNLNRITLPVLLVVGSNDKLGTTETAGYAFEHILSKNKELHIFSKANGYSADYGHCDLILGKKSKEEVYSYIFDWLIKN